MNLFFNNWPFYKRFGFVSLTPLFFLLGAAYEFALINLTINQVNFYEVYKKKEIEKALLFHEIIHQKD
jgi:UPF0640 protein CG32736